jgi:cyclohexyl-isocyanide hydratase
MNRRQFAGVALATTTLGMPTSISADDKAPIKSEDNFKPIHDKKRPEVGMLLYPGMTLLDLLGPQTVLAMSCNVHLLWKTRDLIETDSGVVLKPGATFDDCPKDLDVLFVGGGPGQISVMQDREIIQFMADRGNRAKYVTSVCSGSLILGAAGLLRGYESACHWACLDALHLFGAKPVAKRVVVDRNRISGSGVTAGIDFGLTLLAQMLGEDVAKMTQLAMEYDPQPPFDAGSPKKAGPEITKKVKDWLGSLDGKMLKACQTAAKAMPK